MTAHRETFASRIGTLIVLIGAVMGLGNVWRFPYMVGKFGGAAFVLVYLLIVVGIGIPGLMAEWALGRSTRRGTVGAFARGGLPGGRAIGWFFFAVVTAAMAYYTNVIGWVLFYAIGELGRGIGAPINPSAVLPPETGVSWRSLIIQMVCTATVLAACAVVVTRGVRAGIERISKFVMPMLLICIVLFIARAVTLPGAEEGIRWYVLKLDFSAIDARVVVAALGQVVFSLSLGGTFMVVYGSYLRDEESLARSATWTALTDTATGILAGFAIFPAVFALGLEPASGPGLLFETLPRVFGEIPVGWLFGAIFFTGLAGAGYLSAVAAFEVLVVALTDNMGISRRHAVMIMAAAVFLFAIPPMVNLAVFIPWDLTFGSGMQTLGALVAVLTVGWAMNRSEALRQLNAPLWLYWWIRVVIPGAILVVGLWWLATSVLGVATDA